MTELSIRPEEIRDALDNFVQSYEPGTASREEVGRVSDAGDGIAHVEGLPSCMTNELLQFEDGTLGLALNLDVHEIGVVILGDQMTMPIRTRSSREHSPRSFCSPARISCRWHSARDGSSVRWLTP